MKFIKENLPTVLVLSILSVFAVQTYFGAHGLQENSALKARIAGLEKKLQILRDQKIKLERQTGLMSSKRVDRDMLEAKARELLNFVYANERVYVSPKK